MRKKDYKTKRNKTPREFSVVRPLATGQKQLNDKTIKKLFPLIVVENKMNKWEQQFIDTLKKADYIWTQKQVAVLRKLEKKYENSKTKHKDAGHKR